MEVSTKFSNSGHISEAIDIYYRPEAVHVEQPWMTHLPTIFVGDARNGVEKTLRMGVVLVGPKHPEEIGQHHPSKWRLWIFDTSKQLEIVIVSY